MKRQLNRPVGIVSAVVMVISSALWATATLEAHHSYAAFDREHPVSVEGDIERVVFANPHVVISLRTDSTTYSVEWGNLNQMLRWSVTKDTLKAGDHVVVTAAPTHDPNDLRLSVVTGIRRPSDGWHWTR